MEKEWDDVEAFVSDLKSALDEEAKTIRETEFDQVGEYRTASLQLPSDIQDWKTEIADVFTDRLGRVILPPSSKYAGVISVTFLDNENGGKATLKRVVRIETRFRGEKLSAYVAYLEN